LAAIKPSRYAPQAAQQAVPAEGVGLRSTINAHSITTRVLCAYKVFSLMYASNVVLSLELVCWPLTYSPRATPRAVPATGVGLEGELEVSLLVGLRLV